ncbi:hypothetical protein FB00_13505 [Cellulosimicrobium funkei]|uniref:Helicase n=1 Tax=Cellulosimicrobium funkei TaxID=264251 RepID=A0A0H2KQT5_9MICO|nr:AAA domain-containing protein [Cellulosimicrobium funkei]KLN34189.1 hypothetical protein FB00_13505 [Cellulosimicrobium funkei]
MSITTIDDEYATLQDDLTGYFLDGGRLAVIKAPPGSGKTYTLIEVLSALVAEGKTIAIAAQTNSQADDICARFHRDHPEVQTTRFASTGNRMPADFPGAVPWITDKNTLPITPGVTVTTTAKWSLTELQHTYDLLAIDESWQMSWADLMQCALISGNFLMIGDPGQIPPVVTIDVRRWETSPRAPHEAAPNVVLGEQGLLEFAFVGSLPACRRLPSEAVDFIKPFYDFDFHAYVPAGSRGLDLPADHALARLGDGQPVALTVPTPDQGPPIEVDHEIAALAARVVHDLISAGASVRDGGQPRLLVGADIGISSSHRVMNAAVFAALGTIANEVRVDTPERWQGLERPVMIAVHPLSGVTQPSAFDLETGRLCVMASRHQSALIVLTRDHVGTTLANHVPSAEQAPGRPDTVGRGHDSHIRFWNALQASGRVLTA